MKCPFCSDMDSRVVDSRLSKDGLAIRRRRQCERCKKRFTTYERLEQSLPLVVKKDGRRENFEREKLRSGILKACQKRPVSLEEIERFLDDLQNQLQESGEREIPSRWLGEQVMAWLQQRDEVAYVRFASVYRSFRDLNEFMSELQELLRQSPPPARNKSTRK